MARLSQARDDAPASQMACDDAPAGRMIRDDASAGRIACDDRGQILVVGAFAIALLLVALAVVLNGAAVTENLATDGDGGAVRDAIRLERDAKAGVAGAMVAVNREGYETEADLETALVDAVAEWSAAADENGANRGVSVTVDDVSVGSYGVRVAQENDSRTFADANGSADWTLASDADDVPLFRARLNRSSLTNETAGDPFTVIATDGADTWRATFVDNGTATNVTVEGPGGTTTCSTTANETAVDFVAGSLGNQSCSALSFSDDLAGPYTVGFENATNATGTFELVVGPNATVADDGRFGADGPTRSPALYEVQVSVDYESARVSYGNTITVEVGEARA